MTFWDDFLFTEYSYTSKGLSDIIIRVLRRVQHPIGDCESSRRDKYLKEEIINF